MINDLKINKIGIIYSTLVIDNEGNESTIYARKKSDLKEYYKLFKN
jgi:hypothetical protein